MIATASPVLRRSWSSRRPSCALPRTANKSVVNCDAWSPAQFLRVEFTEQCVLAPGGGCEIRSTGDASHQTNTAQQLLGETGLHPSA